MTRYSPDDAGCYVDAARGIYAPDGIVEFARAHGARIDHGEDCVAGHTSTCFPSEWAGCDLASEAVDEATDYMNATYPVPGHYWGFAPDSGDWGLWPEVQ